MRENIFRIRVILALLVTMGFSFLIAENINIVVPDQYYATGSVMSSDGVNWEYDGEGDVGYARPAIHAGFMFAWEHRGFAWFDLSELPGGAVILDIELNVFCTQNSLDPTQMVNVSSMTELPEPGSASATAVANSMTGYYFEDWDVMQQVGYHSIYLNTVGIAGLQDAIQSEAGFFGLGFVGENTGEIPDGSIGGFSDPNPPNLNITYTLGESGDVNNDGSLDILDIMQIVSFILGTSIPDGYQSWAADFNNDGLINIMDILPLLNCIVIGC